jgi:predicted nucleic acid-binding Zn ribbon protein
MKVCIVCQKDISGKNAVTVKEDSIIRAIRTFKQFFHIAANNELYVCSDDIQVHEKRRGEFERSMIFFGVLSALVVIVLIGTLLLSGRFDIFAFISAIVRGVFILLLSVVFKYSPALEKDIDLGGGRKPLLPKELEAAEEKSEKYMKKEKGRL